MSEALDAAAFFCALSGARLPDATTRTEALAALVRVGFDGTGPMRQRAVVELRERRIALGRAPVGGCGLGDDQVRECVAAEVSCWRCELAKVGTGRTPY
jgi:hypothetical protein